MRSVEKLKRKYEFYSRYDHTGIEKHLGKMAAKGWMLKEIGTRLWKYRRIEPQNLSFSVIYYPAKVINDEMTAERQIFIDSHTVAGWKFVASYGRLHVFCNESENPVPIETDAKTQVDRIHKFAKSEIVYNYLFVFVLSLGVSVWLAYALNKEPIKILSDALYKFWYVPFCIPCSLFCIIKYYLWYKKAVTAAQDGAFTETKRIFPFDSLFYSLWFFGGLAEIYTFFSPGQMLFGAVVVLFAVLLFFLFKFIRKTYEKSEMQLNSKRTLNVIAGVILIVGFVAGSVGIHTLFPKRSETIIDKSEGYTHSYDVYYDKDLPLDMEALIGVDGAVSKYKSREWLFLIDIEKTEQFSVEDMTKELKYDITYINYPLLYDACKEEIQGTWRDWYVKTDHALWGADEVYRLCYEDEPTNRYVVCWPDRIVEIYFGWEPTDEQIAIASEKLMNAEM